MSLNNFGLELEFGSPILDFELAECLEIDSAVGSIYLYENSSWVLGEDFSVVTSIDKDLFGVELKSPKFQIFPEESLSTFCDMVKKEGCRTTLTSGLHFHFSGPSFVKLCHMSSQDLQTLAYRLFCLAKPNKERSKYCDYNTGYKHKRCALRQVNGDHWECRVFNSTLNVDVIKSNFYKMLEVLNVT